LVIPIEFPAKSEQILLFVECGLTLTYDEKILTLACSNCRCLQSTFRINVLSRRSIWSYCLRAFDYFQAQL
jgi:hypothetical protein